MKIGLYFGSFNPVHIGHLIIASYVGDHSDLDKIWLVVSPQNPLKAAGSLLNEQHRLSLVKLAVEGDQKLAASNIEFRLPKPSFTVDTLTYLAESYPQHQFSIILGSDGFANIKKWKNYQQILNNYNIFIYIRQGFEPEKILPANIRVMHAPLLGISSTLIRRNIREGKSIRYLVPESVEKEIEAQGYYCSELENPAQ